MKMKHNKKRNTAILYEILTQQFTQAIVNQDVQKKDRIANTLKKYFKQGTVLGEELELYKALYETKGLQRNLCERLVLEVSRAHASNIDRKIVYKQQSALINEINKEISPDAFKTFIPNYKSLASIAQLFSAEVTIKSKVLLEQNLIDLMSETEDEKKEQLLPIDNIVYNKFVERFNQKYGDSLLEEQKELISNYISSFADNGLSLKIYLNEEIGRLKTELRNVMKSSVLVEDVDMSEKAQRVLDLLQESDRVQIDTPFVEKIAKIQGLIKELAD